MIIINFIRQNIYFLLGLIIGLLTSLVFIPLLENDSKLSVLNENNYSEQKVNDDYEPQINLAGKPLKAQKVPQSFVRPRYFSTELGIKEKLLVSVLSSSTSIESNAIAINKTVAHLAEKIIYFMDTSSKLNISKLNMPDIVAFIDSRHILKPFHMFKYLIDNYLQEFDYFFLVNDSSYINFRRLYSIVRKISVRENLYYGEKIDKNSLYCNLNAGILLSNSILKFLEHNIDWCIKNIDSDSNDINIGRCILHAANVQCTSDIMGQSYSSFNIFHNSNVNYELQYLKNQPQFNNAVTIYPIIKEDYFYILHTYFTKKGLQSDLDTIKELKKSIEKTSKKYPDLLKNLTWPIGNQPGNVPHTRFDILPWKYFTNTSLYLRDDFTTVSNHTDGEMKDIQHVLNTSIKYINNKYSGMLKFEQFISGYMKIDLSRGMDYILHLEFRNLKNELVQKRIQVCKPLGKIDILKVPYVTENTRINIILPVQLQDVDSALHYLQQYKKICMDKKEKSFLMLVLLYEPHLPGKDSKHDIYKKLKDKALSLSKDFKRDNHKITWLSIKLPKNSNLYTHVHDHLLNFAILDLALKKFSGDSLIFFTNPYTELYNDFLNRIRMNTIQGYQVFSPIPFSEYSPNITQHKSASIDINKNIGHFNVYNHDHISFYVKDYLTTRNNIVQNISRVHKDKDILNLTQHISLYDSKHFDILSENIVYMFRVYAQNLHLLKGTEPNLRVYYNHVPCHKQGYDTISKKLYERCVFLRNYNLGSRSQLSKSVLQYISKVF
uniref:Hexosyltransferase n=1 Tax=Cacopsylla melanoneura TaxID=428564 RepID=A0A8D8M5D0_9HEMI